MTSEFKRENRYIVIKRKDLDLIGPEEAESIETTLEHIQDIFRSADSPDREYLVIESDWPEYEPVWAVIEARMTGPAPQPPALGGEPEVYGWVWTEELKGVEVHDGVSFGPEKPNYFSHIGTTFQYAPLYTQHVVAPLLAEIERLQNQSTELAEYAYRLEAERDTLKARCTEALGLLRFCEWHYEQYDETYHRESGYRCPECGSYKADGHNNSCDIGNFIASSAAPAAKDGE